MNKETAILKMKLFYNNPCIQFYHMKPSKYPFFDRNIEPRNKFPSHHLSQQDRF